MIDTVPATIQTAFGRKMPVEIVEFDGSDEGPVAAIILPSGKRAVVKKSSLDFTSAPTPEAPKFEKLEPGMYYHRGPDSDDIFKVQKSRDSDRVYAKRLVVIGGNRLTEVDTIEKFDFEYAPGAMRFLKAEERMTIDEARAFGIQYGICCVCGIRLKDATSVALGIGPVCGGRL